MNYRKMNCCTIFKMLRIVNCLIEDCLPHFSVYFAKVKLFQSLGVTNNIQINRKSLPDFSLCWRKVKLFFSYP